MEGLLPIDVTNFIEGCYGSLQMEWLRTNGVCFLAHGAGMVDRALIECALKKGGFPKQWEDCVLVPSQEGQT